MAGGNLGDLFISLGIKDEMSKTLQKIVKGMNGVDQATQDAKKRGEELVASLNQVNGSNFSKIFREANEYIEKNSKGIANIAKILKGSGRNDANILTGKFLGAGNLAKIASLFGTINSELQRMSKNEDDADRVKAWQNRISNALAYIKLLQDINIQEKKISNTKAENPNVDTKSLDNAKKSLNELRESIISLIHSGGVDDSNILSSLTRVLGMAKKDVQDIISTFKKDNPLSAFTGGAAKVEADIARVTEKLAKMRDLMSEGTQKGYSTSMLTGSISELDNILTRLNAAKLNPTMLTDAAQMKNLISDVLVETIKATVAIQAYNREKGKIVTERKTADSISGAEKRQEKLISSTNILLDNIDKLNAKSITLGVDTSKLDYIRQEIGRIKSDIGSFAGKDLLGQSFKNTITELSAWREKANAALKDQSKENASVRADERQLEQTEARFRRVKELLSEVNRKIVEYNSSYDKGLKVGADISKIQNAIIGLSHFYDKLNQVNVSDKKEVIELISEYRILTNKIGNAKAAQDKLNSSVEKINKSTDRQLGADLENTKRRIQSLDKALKNLQEKTFTSKMLGLDVSEATAKIAYLKGQLDDLRILRDRLERGDRTAVGQLGNLGNGREVQAANNLAASYDKANKEAQRGVEIERKRQQAIVDSGAKIQSQLVRGFEKANSHAGKLNSTVQDLKSLFLQGGLVFGAQQFAMSIITTGGEMEKQHIALQSILGDMQNANTMFNQIKELALNSPFTFSELNRDVKQLAAYGVEYDQLYDTTKRLADMSSGLGVSFDRIALAFGQVQARGWLDGKELRQIAYAGIPLLEKLSEFYSKQEGRNVSTSEVKTRISNREVGFDDVKSIFWQMTDAGGQFYNMQQVLSETLLGRYNKLKDAWEIMLADFADGKSVIGGTFKFILDQVTNLVQLMHTFSPVVIGAMSGFAMKKMGTLLAGSAASNFLTNKEKIAQDIKARALSGQQLSAVEQRILATKKQITKEDLQTLIAAKAITKTELQRLYLSGKISREMYKQAMAQAGMNTFWTNFANKGGVAISLLGKGLGSMVSSLWAMIGGLPGLILTAVTMGVGYAVSKYQELSRAIEQSQSELADRLKQIRDFRMDNSSGMAKALADGDAKEIDNLIDSYKEKLKELAPYNFNNLVMKADEKKSHEERLKYLDQELQKLQEAEKLAKSKLNSRSNYGDLKDAIDYANQFYDNKDKLTYKYISDGVDKNIARQKAFSVDKYAEFNANQIKDQIQKIFGDISKDDTLRLAAEQAMSSVFSTLGVSEDRANEIRASVLQAFGIGGKDSWLQGEVRTKMQALIDDTFPEIGAKIRASIPLTKAEQDKVKELMDDAKQGLVRQYPELERTLQGMLANSNFQAVIKLVFATDDKFNNMTSELIGRIPNSLNGLATKDVAAKYRSFAKKWGKDDSWYGGRNAAKSDIDAAYNEYQSAVKSKSKDVNSKRDAWILVRDAAKTLLYYDYTGEGKKSNKTVKKNKGGRQEDAQLKRLQERLSSLKSARQMYQKYKSIMPDEEAKEKTYNLFPEVTGLNLDDYQKAVHSLLEGFSINTTERKKFQTSIYREVAEWLFDEKDKKEYERKAADFSESMNKLSERWDLYKSLLEKTGSKFFAESAWIDAFQMDDKVKSLMDEYYAHYHEIFNLQDSLSMTDGEAKEKLKLPNQYEEWKKITELLRGNYVKSLQDAANIIEKTEDYEDKILKIRQDYDKLISKTNDPGIKARYEIQRDKEIGQVKLDKFKNSSDYLNFYGAIVSLGMDKAQAIGARIRQNINEALQSGAIDAREYAKEIKQLDEQLSKLTSPKKTFLNGGLKGMAEQKISDASEQMTLAASKIAEGKRIREEGLKSGDLGKIAKGNYLIASGESMMKAAEILFKDGTKAKESLDKFANVVSIIDQNVQGMCEAFNDIKETASLLGVDTESDGWQDASAFFETFSGMSSSLSKVVTSAESGNIGGILAGVTGIFTSPIKAFAKAHDAKLDRQIKLAERQLNELKNLSSNINSVIEKTLGGIYSYERSSDSANKLNDVKNDYRKWDAFSKTDTGKSFFGGKNLSHYSKETYDAVMKTETNPSAYADQLALLHAQEDELRKQRQAEEDKKKTDKDKLADYDQQIKEMELQIKTFAQDFLKDVYSIDMKSWASTLTDTIVSAWAKGEDAVDAYREKVKDMVRDVTKNIVSQKIMEKALEKPLEWLTGILDEKGKLDETDMNDFADRLYEVGEKVVPQLTGIFDALKDKGLDLRENGTSSTTNSVKSITEETADILVSYVNSMRLDLSVVREMQGKFLPEMSEIAKSQLTQLNLIAQNTLRNADAAERIEKIFIEYNDNFNRVINGTKSLKMK